MQRVAEALHVRDRFVVDLGDDVLAFDPLRGGDAVLRHIGYDDTLGGAEMQSFGDVLRDLLDLQSEFVRIRRRRLIRRALFVRGASDFIRKLTGRDTNLHRLPFAPKRQLDVLADFLFQNLALQLRVGADCHVIDLCDDIARPQIAFAGRCVGFDLAHDDAFLHAFEQPADARIVA